MKNKTESISFENGSVVHFRKYANDEEVEFKSVGGMMWIFDEDSTITLRCDVPDILVIDEGDVPVPSKDGREA